MLSFSKKILLTLKRKYRKEILYGLKLGKTENSIIFKEFANITSFN